MFGNVFGGLPLFWCSTANITGCLENTDLENADLENTNLENADLENTDLDKTQTSQFKTSLKTHTFDENSLRVVLIFPIEYGYWRADFPFFGRLTFTYSYCWTGNKNRQQ